MRPAGAEYSQTSNVVAVSMVFTHSSGTVHTAFHISAKSGAHLRESPKKGVHSRKDVVIYIK